MTAADLKGYIKSSEFADCLELFIFEHETQCVVVSLAQHDKLLEFVTFLKNCKFCLDMLVDVCAVDYLGVNDKRFEVVYHFLSIKHNIRLRLKVKVNENEKVDSICGLYLASNWYEREIFDMYGIEFNNHPDLRRILTDYGFDGHPMRKDFPLTGFVQVKYDIETKSVVNEPVELMQNYRSFDFEMPFNYVKNVFKKPIES